MAYNGMGERVREVRSDTNGTDTRHFVYDNDGRLLGEYGATLGDIKAEHIWLLPELADGGLFGGDDGQGGWAPLAVATPTATGGTQIAWVYGDHLGVPLLALDAGGNPLALSGFAVQGFPGQRRTLPDLYYNRYRDYDPTTGRYIQADPIGLAGGASPYSYAMNNPLRYTDPTGEFGLIGAGIGAGTNFGIQFGLNLVASGFDFRRSFRCVDFGDVLISGLVGATGPGLFSKVLRGKTAQFKPIGFGKIALNRAESTAYYLGVSLPGSMALKIGSPALRFGDDCECKDMGWGGAASVLTQF